MTTDFPKVWTPQEIAKVTQTQVQDVLAEIENGRLRAFRVGSEPRVTDSVFRAFVDGLPLPTNTTVAKSSTPPPTQPPAALAAAWKQEKGFTYVWPNGQKEVYDTRFETDLPLPSGQRHFVIGYTKRAAAGIKDRQRIVVFLGVVPKVVPLVEFCGTNDFAQTQHVVSIIKDSANKHARSPAQVPAEYEGITTAIYSDVVVGPYAARSIAVMADNDDHDLMLRHAFIRANFKGIIRG